MAGDAKQADLGAWKFDIIWQDAFSPRKNPDLWSADWFDKLKKSASPDAHLFTYSVAGTVKEALTTSGWQYEKIKRNDSLHKKQWLKAYISKT